MTKRREFIKKSVLGTAAITIDGMGFSSKSYASIIGSKYRMGVTAYSVGYIYPAKLRILANNNETKELRSKGINSKID